VSRLQWKDILENQSAAMALFSVQNLHSCHGGNIISRHKTPTQSLVSNDLVVYGPRNGASALALQQNFGIGSYRTAGKVLSKLRSCAVLPLRSQLTGIVEVDEAFLGGVNNKEIIGIAAEKRGSATGRVRMKHLKSCGASEIQGFITACVEQGATIISGRHNSYPTIVNKGYLHEPQKKPYFWEEVDGDDERLLPHVHRATSLLKRWYYGTYQGRVHKQNLQFYLDEFVFRFNRRTSGHRGLVFHRMVEAAVRSKPRPKSGR
jgi:hypothetical protein